MKPFRGDERTYAIIGAAMEVHRELRPGFLEAAYHEALGIELAERQIPHQREVSLPIFYKGRQLGTPYRADLVCFESVVVEIKSLSQLTPAHEAQLIHYLKATRLTVGLLLNFDTPSPQHKRLIQSA